MATSSSVGTPGSTPGDQDIGTDDQTQAGYTIEINVAGDGSITVGVESADEESSEESGDSSESGEASGSDDDNAQPVKSIKEALSIVMDIYKNSGQMSDIDSGDDQFNSGYSGASSAGGM